MKARLVAAVLLVLAVPTASAESMKHLSKRVFELARVQYTHLDDQLGPAEFPRSLHPDGSLWKSKQNWWCSGFWPGMLWYTFAGTNDPDMAARADRNTHKLDGLIETPTHHDIGFQLNSSFGNAAQIAGIAPGPVLRDGALKLAGRFNPGVGAIKSWESGKRGQYPVIIDNMMNLYAPLHRDHPRTDHPAHAFPGRFHHLPPGGFRPADRRGDRPENGAGVFR